MSRKNTIKKQCSSKLIKSRDNRYYIKGGYKRKNANKSIYKPGRFYDPELNIWFSKSKKSKITKSKKSKITKRKKQKPKVS